MTDTSKTGGLRRFSFSSLQLKIASGLGLLVLLSLVVFAFDYTMAVSRQAELKRLRAENKELNSHIETIKEKVSRLSVSLQRVEDFSHKLKTIMGRETHDDSAIGPIPSHYHEPHYREGPSLDLIQKEKPIQESVKKKVL